MGNFVVFSPSFDSGYMELADSVAAAVRQAAPFHLLTQHPGTDLGAAKAYHGKTILDFCGLQSGAGWGSDRSARLPPLEMPSSGACCCTT